MSSTVHADRLLSLTKTLRTQLLRRALRLNALAFSPLLLLSNFSLFYIGLWLALLLIFSVAFLRGQRDKISRLLNEHFSELEDSVTLLTTASRNTVETLQQQRLTQRLNTLDRSAFASRILQLNFSLLCASFSACLLIAVWHFHQQPTVQSPAIAPLTSTTAAVKVSVRVVPPSYTSLPEQAFGEQNIQVAEGSAITWCISAAQNVFVLSSDGETIQLNNHCATKIVSQSFSWRWQDQHQHGNWFVVEVIADLAPNIEFITPNEAVLTLAPQAKTARLQFNVNDDYAIQNASVQMTLARGSGENVRFTNREIPVPKQTQRNTRLFDKSWSLAELGMEPGDELYIFVRANDNATPAQTTQSATYTIRLPGPVAEGLDSTALPSLAKPESLRSQRQIILDTEALIEQLPALSTPQKNERSKIIANDQAALRRRYGEFLGEESSLFGNEHGDEGGGGLDDVLHNFGHAHDGTESATLFDEKTKALLRRALMAMWDAEKHLRVAEVTLALPFEYQALESIKDLQRAERIYLHRTAFAPPPIKEEARLSGERDGIQSKRWLTQLIPDNKLHDKVDMISALHNGLLPTNWQTQINNWLTDSSLNDMLRIEAQQQLREVADGCISCRASLRAYLRQTITPARLRWQAAPYIDEPQTP